MSRTNRNLKHARWFRNPTFKNAVQNAFRYVDELLELGYEPRPRDKALANVHGEKVMTNWDDVRVSALDEDGGIPYWFNGPVYEVCDKDHKFAQGPFYMHPLKGNYCHLPVYLASPKNLATFGRVRFPDGKEVGIWHHNMYSNEIIVLE